MEPSRFSTPSRVRSSVLSGWWVSRTSGGMGILSAASSSASMATTWTASPLATGKEKRVSPLGTNDTLVCDPPTMTLRVPVIAVTSASINAVSAMLSCPVTVHRLMASSTVDAQSEAMTPPTIPGVQPKEATPALQTSPATDGRG